MEDKKLYEKIVENFVENEGYIGVQSYVEPDEPKPLTEMADKGLYQLQRHGLEADRLVVSLKSRNFIEQSWPDPDYDFSSLGFIGTDLTYMGIPLKWEQGLPDNVIIALPKNKNEKAIAIFWKYENSP